MKHCIKTASGFGGCNAAIVLTLPAYQKQPSRVQSSVTVHTTATVSIENSCLSMNGETVFSSSAPNFAQFIREAYKNTGGSNMKFYKMDDLCKLGYTAVEYIFRLKVFLLQQIFNSSISQFAKVVHFVEFHVTSTCIFICFADKLRKVWGR